MHTLLTLSNLNDITEPNKTIIIKVGADWCVPCKTINPLYHQFANKNNNANIIYTEINTSDADDELLDFVDVKSLPTFLIYKNNELLNKIIGCDKLTISECLNNLE
jgi:thioredoxin 1